LAIGQKSKRENRRDASGSNHHAHSSLYEEIERKGDFDSFRKINLKQRISYRALLMTFVHGAKDLLSSNEAL
jgi:hypothetical protein